MWVYALIAAVLAALLGPVLAGRPAQEHAVNASGHRALAEGMAVYRTAVIEWARTQPAFEGVVAETAVAGPAWSQRNPMIRAAVQNGFVAVYLDGTPPAGVLEEVQRLGGGSIWVGLAYRSTGTLHTPGLGDTGLLVPQWVPDQAPTWLAKRD